MQKKRFKIFFGIISVLFFVILCKLFYIQMIEGGKFSGISNNKRIRTVGIDTLRGTIYDRNGLVLAVDKHSFELTVMYKKLFNAYSCFNQNILPEVSEGRKQGKYHNLCSGCHIDKVMWVEKVAELLDVPYTDIFNEAAKTVKKVEKIKNAVEKKNRRKIRVREETVPHSIASHIPWEKVAKFEVEMLNLPGIQIETNPVRWYPQGDMSSHVIGYVGKLGEEEIQNYNFKKRWFDSLKKSGESESEFFAQKAISMDALIGKSGIEKTYNSRLMGIPEERFEEVTLDTQTGVVFSAAEKKAFTFTNSTSYVHWRIDITLNNGDGVYVGIEELEFIEKGVAGNAILIPADKTVDADPSDLRFDFIINEIDAISLGTDLTVEGSRDGGTTYTAGTVTKVQDLATGDTYIKAEVDVSAQPTGTGMKYKMKTFNNKEVELKFASQLAIYA